MNQRRGFTLIEFIIYLGLLSLIAGTLLAFSLSIEDTREVAHTNFTLQSNGRVALDVLSRTIRSARAVNVAGSDFTSHLGMLSLSMPSASENPTIFSVNQSGQLTIKEGNTDPIALTDTSVVVSSFSLEYIGNKSVWAHIVLSLKNSSSTTYSLRITEELKQ